jgi:hypothetical protein
MATNDSVATYGNLEMWIDAAKIAQSTVNAYDAQHQSCFVKQNDVEGRSTTNLE